MAKSKLPNNLRASRNLRFPDEPVGWVDLRAWQDPDFPHQGAYSPSFLLELDPTWKRLGEAREAVTIPAGYEARLRVNRKASKDPALFTQLEPASLQSLNLEEVAITEDLLRSISDLSGLQSLSLRQVQVRGETLMQLSKLSGLRHFLLTLSGPNNLLDRHLVFLGAFPHLSSLCLDASRLTGSSLAYLQRVRQLTALCLLRIHSFTVAGWEQLSLLHTLQGLDLRAGSIDDSNLAYIGKLSNLLELNLSNTQINGTGFPYLKHLTKLKALQLNGDYAIRETEFTHLSQHPNLEIVRCSEMGIGESGIVSISQLPALRSLDLTEYATGLRAIINAYAFEKICRIPRLHHLMLAGAEIAVDGFPFLAELTHLETLDLQGTSIRDADLASIENLRQLRVLNLSSTDIMDQGLQYIVSLPNLQELPIAWTKITREGLKYLRKLHQLRKLSLGPFEDLKRGDFENLGHITTLEYLNLSGENIDDQTIIPLYGLTNLQKLFLLDTSVTDDGLAILKNFPLMNELQINRSPIGDAGLQHIAMLSNLVLLDLSDTQVTEASLPVLGQLHGLEFLRLDHTSISRKAINELRGALPNCMIYN